MKERRLTPGQRTRTCAWVLIRPLSRKIFASPDSLPIFKISRKKRGILALGSHPRDHAPTYSTRVPFGLSRIAPVVVGQALFLDDDPANVYPQNTFEWGWGADLDLLLLHKIPARVRYLNAYDTRSPSMRAAAATASALSYKYSF